jgi:RNA polymerase sigma factor (sigma-70 family)
MGVSDQDLLTRWMERHDAEAFREIASRHSGMVYATCKRVLGDATEAEDVAQECFEMLARKGKQAGSFVGAWLHKVATNRCLMRLRAEKRRRDREMRFAAERNSVDEARWDDIYGFVDEAIADLPDKLRMPIVLHFFENQTHDAIAQRLGTSRQTVTYRIGKGIEAIRKSLKKRGVQVASGALAALMASNLAEAAPIPASLAASVARLALAGGAKPVVTGALSVTSGARVLGGLLSTKTVVIGILAVVTGVTGLLVGTQRERPEPVEPVRATTSPARALMSRTPRSSVEQTASPAPAQVAEEKQGSQEQATIMERKGVPVSGTVTLPSGLPAEGAQVTGYTEEPEFRTSGLTKGDGTFQLAGFSVGSDLYLYAETDEFAGKLHGPIPLTEGGLQDFTIALFELGGVRGVVVDMEEHPVALAGVKARPREKTPPVPLAYTDENGDFALTDLVPGEYTLWPIPPGREDSVSSSYASVIVRPAQTQNDVKIVLDMGGDLSISGRVIDSDGRPIPGAFVYINERIERHTQTDQEGNYRLAGLSDTTYAVTASRAGYALRTQWQVAAGSEDVDFVLPRKQTTFTGRVVRADTGEPITEFEVMAVDHPLADPTQFRQYKGWPFENCRDPEGRFEIEGSGGMGGAWATVVARAPGFAVGYDAVRTNPEGPPVEALVRLEPEALVTGIVVDAVDEPVPGAHVVIGPLPSISNIAHDTAAYSRDDGTFDLDGISKETSMISAYHPDYAPASVGVSPRPGETESVRVVLHAGGALEGEVTAEGQPLRDAYVSLEPVAESAGSSLNTRTDSSGRFRFASLAPGSMEVSAFFPSDGEGTSIRRLIRRVLIENGRVTHVNFDFPVGGAVLEGSVCYGTVPASSGFARVYCALADGEEFRGASFEGGAFRVDDLPAGSARVEISAFFADLRHIVGRRTHEILLNESKLTQITVDFAQGGRLGGVVTGVAPSDAWVDVFAGAVDPEEIYEDQGPAGGLFGRLLVWQGSVQQDGTFYAVGFDPGTYTVVVSASKDDASTLAELRATSRAASLVVQLADGQETWVEIPMR